MGCGGSKSVDAAAPGGADHFDAPRVGFTSGRGQTTGAAGQQDLHSRLPPDAQPSRIASPKLPSLMNDATLFSKEQPKVEPKPAAADPNQITLSVGGAQQQSPPPTATVSTSGAAAAPAAPPVDADAAAAAAAAAAADEELITGVLLKRGEAGSAGQNKWTDRFVVLSGGVLTYYKKEADYHANKPPRKNNKIPLRHYAVAAGEPAESAALDPSRAGRNAANDPDYARSFYLRPLPVAGVPPRVWEFRAVEAADLEDWLAVFREHGCVDRATGEALAADVGRAAAILGPTHPLVREGVAFAPQPPPAVPAAAAAAAPSSPAPAPSSSSVASSVVSSPGSPAPVPAPSYSYSPAAASAAPAAASASAAVSSPPSAYSDPAAVAAATTAALPALSLRPYDAAGMVLSAAQEADLSDPGTDAGDPHFAAGYLLKRGDGLLAGYKQRWVALKHGFMMYYDSEAARKAGAKPNHGNHIPLSAYRLVLPPASQYLHLEPIHKAGPPAVPGVPAERVWELQVPSKHEADKAYWVVQMHKHGAAHDEPAPAAPAAAAAAVAGAEASPPPPAVGVAANGYDPAAHPDVWEICTSEENEVYFYHLASGESQWEIPTSDALNPATA